MTTRGKHDKEIGRRRERRTTAADLRARVEMHNSSFAGGGEEIEEELDFTAGNAGVDRKVYGGAKHAPGYQEGNKPADYREC
jgi:hypothetical protein